MSAPCAACGAAHGTALDQPCMLDLGTACIRPIDQPCVQHSLNQPLILHVGLELVHMLPAGPDIWVRFCLPTNAELLIWPVGPDYFDTTALVYLNWGVKKLQNAHRHQQGFGTIPYVFPLLTNERKIQSKSNYYKGRCITSWIIRLKGLSY